MHVSIFGETTTQRAILDRSFHIYVASAVTLAAIVCRRKTVAKPRCREGINNYGTAHNSDRVVLFGVVMVRRRRRSPHPLRPRNQQRTTSAAVMMIRRLLFSYYCCCYWWIVIRRLGCYVGNNGGGARVFSMTAASLSLAARRRGGQHRPTTRPALLLLQHEKMKKNKNKKRHNVQVHRRILSPRLSIINRIKNGTLQIDDPLLYDDHGIMNELFGPHDDGRVVHYLATLDDSKVIGMAQVLPGWQQAWNEDDDDTTTTDENWMSLLPLSSERGHVGTTALWLENIIVSPQYRRLGVATALLQAIEYEAHELAANMTTAMTAMATRTTTTAMGSSSSYHPARTIMTAEDETKTATTTTTPTTVVELRLTSFRTKSALGLYRSLGYRVVAATPQWHDHDDDNDDRVADDRERRRRRGSNNCITTTTTAETASSSILFAKKKDWWSWTCDAKYPTTLDLVKEVRIV
jgi:GNAT superfamily N-acetyltransferase